MKKKIMTWLTVALAVCALAGCGKSDADVPLKDMDVDKYVTMGEYRGIEVSVAPITVDETEWEEITNDTYYVAASAYTGEIVNGIVDRPVEVGDMVNIDFVGKLNDEAFAGGTAEGYNLGIGAGRFIDGFEEGLVGVMPGETVDLQLTFPENYDEASLAGQEVVFTVTVNCIVPEEMDDLFIENWAVANGIAGVTNLEELKQYVYDYLYSYDEQAYNNEVQNAVLDAFMNSCTFVDELPDAMLDKYEVVIRENIEREAGYYGMDAETYISTRYGMTLDDFLMDYVSEALRQDLAFQAVANRENLNVSDEELNEILSGYAVSSGYTSVEEFVGETSLEDYREYFMYDNVLHYLVDNAKIIN
ncbi:MAG: FKBP-type peptidyl-prolyl cis-trans isomerase [Acetatifactor sp.]|nr:FKBP-type peptidyl-prolyl cis-trans isomerase [Acetatifactor sp.]